MPVESRATDRNVPIGSHFLTLGENHFPDSFIAFVPQVEAVASPTGRDKQHQNHQPFCCLTKCHYGTFASKAPLLEGEGQLQNRRLVKQGEGGRCSRKRPSPQPSPRGRRSPGTSSRKKKTFIKTPTVQVSLCLPPPSSECKPAADNTHNGYSAGNR